MPEEFIIAEDLDLAWSNFEPFYPLPANSPFHVERKGKPLNRLKRALLRQHRQSPKYFFSGHRGCGKSTELNRLAADGDINENFFIVKYSVKEVCDVNNLNYVDVLFSIGAQLYIQYIDSGNKLKPELIEQLEGWKHSIEKISEEETSIEASIDGGLRTFFVSVLARIRAEDTTRKTIREIIEPKLSDLIDKINLIIANIESNEKKKVLVLIDDLDKPRLEQAKEIFYNSQTAITQPICYIVYTVPISIFFTKELTAIKESKYFLPNVKLHFKNDRNSKDEEGYGLMERFIFHRMKADLIQPDALNLAITMGAGVFRETARIMQISADSAIENDRDQIIVEDVKRAEREIRSDFKRILKTQDYTTLKEICQDNEIHGIEKIEDLLHNLSVLEYMNDETWCDIHPTLVELIEND
ncbi:MAG: AAA family ATPase [Methanosarcinales archaeon]|nr:AAA family ATPase [Methanosarcinales archaeon]MCD4809679.1 AAA family ATPase [Methanosarcinales archaeon]